MPKPSASNTGKPLDPPSFTGYVRSPIVDIRTHTRAVVENLTTPGSVANSHRLSPVVDIRTHGRHRALDVVVISATPGPAWSQHTTSSKHNPHPAVVLSTMSLTYLGYVESYVEGASVAYWGPRLVTSAAL
ncbi:hypothetical protein D9611_005407 [Ephemerocybe angulata]|uniref:Uncharacterized protein n=1 Tax=Ephemerocybe angulata TaxID=980116 RepID=A0A8H5FD06_9AGAR|nr:hypothetical protein D9611_005400 [Tulosesus angulatus]KAF5332570.1 hypothetical protein D9611_005407 [Tulosesus angulatus]